MNQWMVLFKKECKEMMRNYKWIWIPLVFAILGLSQPLSSYYMPELLESFGELPEGTVIEIPVPEPGAVITAALGQFSQVGVLILVLSTMGVVSSERVKGTASVILAKPVSKTHFITAKWVAVMLVTWLSLFLGYGAAWYYTYILFDSVPLERIVQAFLLYGLWLTFAITLTVFLSTVLKNPGSTAFATLGGLIGLSVLTGTLQKLFYWSPSRLTTHAGSFLQAGEAANYLVLSIITTILLIMALLALGVYLFKQKEFIE